MHHFPAKIFVATGGPLQGVFIEHRAMVKLCNCLTALPSLPLRHARSRSTRKEFAVAPAGGSVPSYLSYIRHLIPARCSAVSGCRQSDHPLTLWHHCPRSPPSSSQRAHAATLATRGPIPTIPTCPSQDSPSLELGIENQDQLTNAAVHAWLTSLRVEAAYAAILSRTVLDPALIDEARPVGGLRTGLVVAFYAAAGRKGQDPARAPHNVSRGNPPPRAEIIFCRWVVALAGGIRNTLCC